jgi:hypothetical protein
MLTSEERLSCMELQVPTDIIAFNSLQNFTIIKPHLSFFPPSMTTVKVANSPEWEENIIHL